MALLIIKVVFDKRLLIFEHVCVFILDACGSVSHILLNLLRDTEMYFLRHRFTILRMHQAFGADLSGCQKSLAISGASA